MTAVSYNEIFQFGRKLQGRVSGTPPVPVPWILDNFIDPITSRPVEFITAQKRILREALSFNSDGRNQYDLIIWSQPKKSGKTTTASAVGAYVANCIEAPNEICCLANDQEHAAGRIFANMIPTLEKLGWDVPVSQKNLKRSPETYGPNGTVVKALTNDYKKQAGGNQGLSLWSELWAYEGERLNRLWDEMTPPPTRKFSMRWVESYAGFINQNILFQEIYLKVFTDFKESALHPNVVQLWDDLPVYIINDHTFVFWDHEHRMPWQTDDYYKQQAEDMRSSAYRRLHDNYWVESEDNFITDIMWRQSIFEPVDQPFKAIYALDASKNNACTALVGCKRESQYILTSPESYIWETKGSETNFSEIEKKVVSLYRQELLQPPLWYDPYQCVMLAQRLKDKGIPCKEFTQGQKRVVADTNLYKFYKAGLIKNPINLKLREHLINSVIKELEDDKLRIVKPTEKEETSNKFVDGAVAQSMAAFIAYTRKAGGWGQSG